HHQRLEQQREPAVRPSPRHMHEAHTARGAPYARRARVKVSLVLKEVEMPPRLLRGVVRPAARNSTLRARERGASLEVQEDVQPPLRRVELRPVDSPRRLKPECLLEKIDVPHDDPPPPGSPGTGRSTSAGDSVVTEGARGRATRRRHRGRATLGT